MAYQLLIFDFDGTLADTGEYMLGVMNEAADRFGFQRIEPEALDALRGQDNRAIIKALRVPMWKMPWIATFVRRRAAEGAEELKLFAGVPEMLKRLRAEGCRLAIVTSNSEATVRNVLGAELAGLIDVYACDAALLGKASKFRQALKQARCRPTDALSVGDEARDIDAARRVGIACGVVTWGYATPALLQSYAPEHVFTSPNDITSR